VIGGEENQLTIPNPIQSAVADIRPIDATFFDCECQRNNRRPHRLLVGSFSLPPAGFENPRIGQLDRRAEPVYTLRPVACRSTAEQGPPETTARLVCIGATALPTHTAPARNALVNDVDRHATGDFTFGPTAHTIGDDEQGNLREASDRVLVGFPNQANVRVRPEFELHLGRLR
jgi:hypothetical protein